MNKLAFHILRIGLAITFIWIGFMIWQTPDAWSGYMQPWAVKLMPIPIGEAMMGTAVLDIILGLVLLSNYFVWIAALVATIHLIIILIVSGITDITVRDIGLVAATLALCIDSLPENIRGKIKILS